MVAATQALPKIEIKPQVALTDEAVTIRLVGCAPRQRVVLRAQTRDDDFRRAWESCAVFEAGADGAVDVSAHAPLEGSYADVDPMGLFWSMQLDPAAEEECYFRKRTLDPMRVTFTAEEGGQPLASATAERLFVASGVVRVEVREARLVGTLFLPAGPGPHPGAVVLGGGDGGLLEHGAALLASRGYAALALAYFNAESLPPEPFEVPLEYFDGAIRWLQARPQVDRERVALIGTSLGGLFALLVGATFPAVKAVVGYVPVGIVLCMGPEGRSPCTYQGRPLPCLRLVPTPEEERLFEEKAKAREPISYNPLHLRALQDEAAVAPAAIPVERITGPVLLVTGQDDQAWPSPVFAERVMARLERHGFPHPHRHLSYAGAGHAIGLPHAHGLPYVPTYGRAPASGPVFAFGGNPRDDAFANADSWRQVLQFLGESLGH